MELVRCDYISCAYQSAGVCKHPGIQIDKDGCCSQVMAKINHDPEWLIEAMRNLRQIDGYPFDYDVDRAFLAGLHVDYPAVDLAKKIIEMRDWLLDKGGAGRIAASGQAKRLRPNYRLRLRHWCENEVKWRGDRPVARTGKGGTRGRGDGEIGRGGDVEIGGRGHRQDACATGRKYIVAGEGIEQCDLCGTATIMKYFEATEREYRVYACQCRGE